MVCPALESAPQSPEQVWVQTVEQGKMTKDLALLISKTAPYQTTQEFLNSIDENLKVAMA